MDSMSGPGSAGRPPAESGEQMPGPLHSLWVALTALSRRCQHRRGENLTERLREGHRFRAPKVLVETCGAKFETGMEFDRASKLLRGVNDRSACVAGVKHYGLYIFGEAQTRVNMGFDVVIEIVVLGRISQSTEPEQGSRITHF